MKGIAFCFFVLGLVAVLIGMVWGIMMGVSEDHTLAPAHAHLNLLGWVGFSIYAFYYHLVPQAAEGLLPRLHLGLAVLSVVVMVPGIVRTLTDVGHGMVKAGSMITVLSVLVFAVVVLRSRAR